MNYRLLTSLSIFVLLVIVSALPAQRVAADDPTPTTTPTGSISGTVRAADGVTPLENIAVTLFDKSPNSRVVCTDVNGYYTFDDVPFNAPFTVYAEAMWNDPLCNAGADYVLEMWQETTAYTSATKVTLTAITPSQSGIDFTLDVGGSVSGTVYAFDGTTPLENVPVLLEVGNGSYRISACSDTLGHYTVHNVPFGMDLRAEAGPDWGGSECGGSWDYSPEFWPETPYVYSATLISLSAPSPTRSGIDFTLVPAPYYIKADPAADTVHVYGWDRQGSNVLVMIEIDRPSNGPGVDFSATAELTQALWDPYNSDDRLADFELAGKFDLQVDDVITANGAGISRTTTVGHQKPIRWFVGPGIGADQPQMQVALQVRDDFNLSHPDIELKLEIYPNNLSYPTLHTEVNSTNAPDVVGPLGGAGANEFHKQWLDMDPLITSTGYDTSQFDPALFNVHHTEEGQVGLPFALYSAVVFYQKDLFDAAGLHYPPANDGEQYEMPNGSMVEWNYDTLQQIARLLTLDSNGKNATEVGFDRETIVQYGYLPQWQNPPNNLGTLWGAGSLYSGTPGSYTATIPAAWAANWKWHYDGMWGTQPFIPSNPALSDPDFGYGNAFSTGHLAMAISQSWYMCCLDKSTNWDLAVLPAYNGQVHGRVDVDTFRIMGSTAHPTEAFTVLAYLTGHAAPTLLHSYRTMGARPAAQDVWLAGYEAEYPFVEHWNVIKTSLSYVDTPHADRWMPSYSTALARLGTFGDFMGNSAGLNLDNEIATLQADLQTIFNTPTFTKATFSSVATQDGWVLESAENSAKGGSLNTSATTFNLGDNAFKKQYRGVLSFNTTSLPDTAVITAVTLKLRKSAITGGGNPVAIFKGFMVDIKNGILGASTLQAADFQASASKTIGPFSPGAVAGVYTLNLTNGKAHINKLATSGGLTQIRLRFRLDDNNDTTANILSLFSGNAVAANRPQLLVDYYMP